MSDQDTRDEFGIIAQYFAPLSSGAPGAFGLSDDAAIMDVPKGYQLVVTKDVMVAGVHFFASDPPDLIARKLLRVNLSDVAAMGAKPVAYALGLGVTGSTNEDWIRRFSEGLAQDQQEYGISLIGGDTIVTPHDLTFSLTAFGLVPLGKVLRREGAKPGDSIFVTGAIGDASLGLAAQRGEIDGDDYLVDRYLLPQPRLEVGQRLHGVATAVLDISDGLMADVGHLCAASTVGAKINMTDIPVSPSTMKFLAEDSSLFESVVAGGDDYELVFTAPEQAFAELRLISSELEVPITRIGICTTNTEVQLINASGNVVPVERTGFKHL